MQVVDVAPAEWENTWIADLRVQDGLADVETPTTVVVEIRASRPRAAPRRASDAGDGRHGARRENRHASSRAWARKEVDFEVVFNTLDPAARAGPAGVRPAAGIDLARPPGRR